MPTQNGSVQLVLSIVSCKVPGHFGVGKLNYLLLGRSHIMTYLTYACRSRWNIGHRPFLSIQLCSVLPPPLSFSCIWNLLSTSFSKSLFYVFFVFFLPLWPCGGVQCIVLVWQCCHRFLLMCPSQFHFLLFNWFVTGSWSVIIYNSLFVILSGLCISSSSSSGLHYGPS